MLKLLVGGWHLSGAESLIQNRLYRFYCDANCVPGFTQGFGTQGFQDFIFLFLMLVKGMRRRSEFKISCVTTGMERFLILLRSSMNY